MKKGNEDFIYRFHFLFRLFNIFIIIILLLSGTKKALKSGALVDATISHNNHLVYEF